MSTLSNGNAATAGNIAVGTAAATPAANPITASNVNQVKPLRSVSLENFPQTTSNFPPSVAFEPSLAHLAATVDARTIRVWDSATGRPLIDLKDKERKPSADSIEGDLTGAMAFSPDGKRLAAGLFSYKGWKITLWDVATGRPLTVLTFSAQTLTDPGIPYSVNAVQFTHDGLSLVASNRLHDNAMTALWNIHTSRVDIIADSTDDQFSLSQKLLAFPNYHLQSGADSSIQIVDLQTQNTLRDLDIASSGIGSQVYGLALSRDGALLAAQGEGVVLVWSVSTGQQTSSLEDVPNPDQSTDSLADMAFSADGRVILADDNGKLHFWDTTTGKTLATLDKPAVSAVAISQDGTRIASLNLSDDQLQFWGIQ